MEKDQTVFPVFIVNAGFKTLKLVFQFKDTNFKIFSLMGRQQEMSWRVNIRKLLQNLFLAAASGKKKSKSLWFDKMFEHQ